MADPDIKRYLKGIGSQHQPMPRFMAHLTRILEKLDAAHGIAKDLPQKFHVMTAEGKQLDAIAVSVGVDRKSIPAGIFDGTELDDDTFRKIILAKIAQNQWDGTFETFRDLWDATLGSWLDAEFTDNQDMTVSVGISGSLSPLMSSLVLGGYIIPKPMGVELFITYNSDIIVSADTDYLPVVFPYASEDYQTAANDLVECEEEMTAEIAYTDSAVTDLSITG